MVAKIRGSLHRIDTHVDIFPKTASNQIWQLSKVPSLGVVLLVFQSKSHGAVINDAYCKYYICHAIQNRTVPV